MPNDPVPGPQPLATLAISAGPRSGEAIPVLRPVVSIGRGRQSDVVLDDDSVSTRHARLDHDMGFWRITDLDSANGTFVDDVRLAPQVPTPLHSGADLRLGAARLLFQPVADADVEAADAIFATTDAESALLARGSGFRLPVWVVVLVLVLIGMAVFFYLQVERAQRGPAEPIPAPTPTTVWVDAGPGPPA